MKAEFLRQVARFDALSLRERMMIFAACVAVAGALMYALLFEPLARERKQISQQIAQQSQVLASTRAAVQALRSEAADPNATVQARREGLIRERTQLNRDLELAARGLVAPERMAALVEALVSREQRLQLVALRTIAPSPLVSAAQTKSLPAQPQQPGSAEKPADGDVSSLYKHGIELTLQGGYHDLAAYLARLEQMPWRMYWSKAVLDAERHPQIALTLTLYTLSLERSWLRL